MCTPKLGVQEFYDSIDQMSSEEIHKNLDELEEVKKLRTLTENEQAVYDKLLEQIQF